MSYSNRVNRSFIIILLLFSLSLLSLLVSVFLIFFSLLSLLLFSFSLTPHSLSALMGLINLFVGLFFSTCFNGSDQPLLFSFTLCWSSLLASTSAWMGLINFRSDQPWVFAWMGLGFGFNQPWEWETKKITKLGSERSGFWLDGGWVMMMVVGFERERERGHEWENNKKCKRMNILLNKCVE